MSPWFGFEKIDLRRFRRGVSKNRQEIKDAAAKLEEEKELARVEAEAKAAEEVALKEAADKELLEGPPKWKLQQMAPKEMLVKTLICI